LLLMLPKKKLPEDYRSEEDLSFWDTVKSLGSDALHAGERVAADAAKKEIARRLGE